MGSVSNITAWVVSRYPKLWRSDFMVRVPLGQGWTERSDFDFRQIEIQETIYRWYTGRNDTRGVIAGREHSRWICKCSGWMGGILRLRITDTLCFFDMSNDTLRAKVESSLWTEETSNKFCGLQGKIKVKSSQALKLECSSLIVCPSVLRTNMVQTRYKTTFPRVLMIT